MESYNKAIAIVIISLMFTGMCGYVLNSEHHTEESTAYTYKGDLTPAVSYSQIDDWTEYNPLKNVTGWTPVEIVPHTSGVANQYPLASYVIEYDTYTATGYETLYLPSSASVSGSGLNAKWILSQDGYQLTSQGIRSDYPDSKTTGNITVVDSSGNDVGISKITGGASNTYYGSKGVSSTTRYYTINSVEFYVVTYYYGQYGAQSHSTTTDAIGVHPLSDFSYPRQLIDGTVLHLTSDVFSKSVSVNSTYNYTKSTDRVTTYNATVNSVITISMDYIPNHDFVWNADTQLLYPAQKVEGVWVAIAGEQGYSLDNLAYLWGQSGQISYEVPERSVPQYADATKLVNVPSGSSALWANEELNGTIVALASANTVFSPENDKSLTIRCPQNTPYDYFLCTLDFMNGQYYCQGVTFPVDNNGNPVVNSQNFTVADYLYQMEIPTHKPIDNSVDFYIQDDGSIRVETNGDVYYLGDYRVAETTTIWSDQKYVTVHIHNESAFTVNTLVGGNGSSDAMTLYPNSTHSPTFPANRMWIGQIKLTTELSRGAAYYPVDGIGYESVHSLTVTAGPNAAGDDADAFVFIERTIVSVDPQGILWGNPVMTLQYYFPDQFKGDTRVLFNGFVKYGNSMTINGIEMAIADGKIYIPNQYIDGSDGSTPFTVKGMAVDFIKRNGVTQVELVFTENRDTRVSLGNLDTTSVPVGNNKTTYNGYIIYGTGTWYWQSGIYSIQTYSEDVVGLDVGKGHFALTMSGACLLMMGMVILCAAAMRYAMKWEFSLMDWVIIIGTLILLGTLALLF